MSICPSCGINETKSLFCETCVPLNNAPSNDCVIANRKDCVVCGKFLEPSSPWSAVLVCSNDCDLARIANQKNCAVCGKPMLNERWKNVGVCSEFCYSADLRLQNSIDEEEREERKSRASFDEEFPIIIMEDSGYPTENGGTTHPETCKCGKCETVHCDGCGREMRSVIDGLTVICLCEQCGGHEPVNTLVADDDAAWLEENKGDFIDDTVVEKPVPNIPAMYVEWIECDCCHKQFAFDKREIKEPEFEEEPETCPECQGEYIRVEEVAKPGYLFSAKARRETYEKFKKQCEEDGSLAKLEALDAVE